MLIDVYMLNLRKYMRGGFLLKREKMPEENSKVIPNYNILDPSALLLINWIAGLTALSIWNIIV